MKPHASHGSRTYRILKILWFLVTLLILSFGLFLEWKHTQLVVNDAIAVEAEHLRNELDGFLSRITRPLGLLQISSMNPEECHKNLLPALSNIEYNNPTISGLVITDQNYRVLCSTITKDVGARLQYSDTPTLHGPLILSENSEPAFVLQRRQGNYYVTAFILKNLLENAIGSHLPISRSVLLYDKESHKILIRKEKDPAHPATPEEIREEARRASLVSGTNGEASITEAIKVQSVDTLVLLITRDNKVVMDRILVSSTILTLVVLLLSVFLYLAVRHMLDKRFSLEGLIRQGIRDNAFYPVFLPTRDVGQAVFCGVEMLARWRNAPEGLGMPQHFIPEAERTGLIVPLTLRLLEDVFFDCQALFRTESHFHLAVNLAVSHFTSVDFFEKLIACCRRYQIPPSRIMLEITERELFDTRDHTLRTRMSALREQGFSLAVDDFGTGHASLAYLQQFPFNYLKMDKSFVDAIGTGSLAETLIVPIVTMAANLKLTLIAEGVETQAQADYLQSLGVQYMQGWLFSKPVESNRLAMLFKENLHA